MNYSIVLSANEIAECNKLSDKTETVKHGCENMKLSVRVSFHENLPHP